jgi:hypothetical protein
MVFFECEPFSSQDPEAPFRFAIIPARPGTRHRPDPGPFLAYIEATTAAVVAFPNLEHDATLVIPTINPATYRSRTFPNYLSLVQFMRRADVLTISAFWTTVAEQVLELAAHSCAPLWLSTSGLAVHWLHMRISSAPNYYTLAALVAPPAVTTSPQAPTCLPHQFRATVEFGDQSPAFDPDRIELRAPNLRNPARLNTRDRS